MFKWYLRLKVYGALVVAENGINMLLLNQCYMLIVKINLDIIDSLKTKLHIFHYSFYLNVNY